MNIVGMMLAVAIFTWSASLLGKPDETPVTKVLAVLTMLSCLAGGFLCLLGWLTGIKT